MIYEKLESCPVCSHKQFGNHIICEDHSVSKESFALVKCGKCGLVFTNPRPTADKLSSYYESDLYISHADKANSLINIAYKLVRNYTIRQKLKLIQEFTTKSSILDYGCGTGHFISSAAKSGWSAYGYEPDDSARTIAQSNQRVNILDSVKKLKDEVGVITAWHVVEHISDLKDTLKNLKKKLANGGYMFIAVPNHLSYDASQYKENWAAYDVPRHLYHFDQEAMKYLIKKLKLQHVDTLPMKFDSYYVSMLSEKYINGTIINAIKTGHRSNKEAKKTGEYSSLIYVLKK